MAEAWIVEAIELTAGGVRGTIGILGAVVGGLTSSGQVVL